MDHSAHAAMGGMGLLGTEGLPKPPPGTIRHPSHGAYLGHILPGCFFCFWGSYWLISVFRLYLKSNGKTAFQSKAWYEFKYCTRVPLEPLLKIFLPFIGINGELWAGHSHYRHLYDPDGHFTEHHLQDWQHSAMYLAFMLSGCVDLLSHYTNLPNAIGHAYLSVAFLIEGMLLAFHLKGYQLEVYVHLLLVLTVFATVAAMFAEMRFRNNILWATARPILVLQQGVWFIQVAHILFRDNLAWDPDYHGSGMMAPVVYVTWFMVVMFCSLLVFMAMKLYYQKYKKTYKPLAVYDAERANGKSHDSFSAALANAERE
jgi:hypothetical protein